MARARICLDEEIEAPQESTVAALCIMGGREASVGRDARGYAYIGMAVAAALDQGLHADVTSWLEGQRITKEAYRIRIVTFWGLVTYEKLWALYVGRPSLIRSNIVTVPTPDQLAVSTGHLAGQNAARQHGLFLLALVELLRMTDSVVEKLYMAPSAFERTTQLSEWTEETERDLSTWLSSLPPFLKLDLTHSDTAPVSPHMLLLHVQYHVTRINLHRPFIAQRGKSLTHPGSAFQVCTASATAIADLFELYRKRFTLRKMAVVATVGCRDTRCFFVVARH